MTSDDEKKPIINIWEKITAVSLGTFFIICILILAIFFPNPTLFQYTVFRIILSLAAAGFASVLPGLLHVQVSTGIRAGGAIAVFVIVYFFSPASLVTKNNLKTSDRTLTVEQTPKPSMEKSVQFLEKSDVFKIAILSFFPTRECKVVDTKIEETIVRRLTSLAEDLGLKLEVQFFKESKCPLTYDDGRAIGRDLKASLVIWGVYDPSCSERSIDARLNYTLTDKPANSTIQLQGQSGVQHLPDMMSIFQGRLQAQVDIVILYSLAIEASNRGEYKTALELLHPNKIVTKHLSDELKKEMWLFRGICQFFLKQYDQSVATTTKIIKLKTGDPHPYFFRGFAYVCKGEIDAAIKDFDKAIELKPDDIGSYNGRGLANLKKGEIDIAIKDYNKAIELKPDDVNTYNNRGLVYHKKGDIDIAIKDFDKAIELRPNGATAYYNRGLVYHKKGDIDIAIKDFDKAIELRPNGATAYYNRGLVYHKKGDIDIAIKDFDKAIELKPDNPHPYFVRGFAYFGKEEIDTAILDYTEAIKLKADFATAYNFRGFAYHKKGEIDTAIKDFNKASELKPDSAFPFPGTKVSPFSENGTVLPLSF